MRLVLHWCHWLLYIELSKQYLCTYYRLRGLAARDIMRLVASVCPSALSRLNRLTYDLDIWYVGRPRPWLGHVPEIVLFNHCYIALGSRCGSRSEVRVKVKVKGYDQISGMQRSILGARFAECSKEQQPPLPV